MGMYFVKNWYCKPSKKTYQGIWVKKSNWTGLQSGASIWKDGENIYYSSDYTQRVLNKSTDTWENKTWSGLTNFEGKYVWTDGNDIYYSYESSQYVLDKTTSTWQTKTWTWESAVTLNGDDIWRDEDHIYCSNAAGTYELT